MIRKIFDDFRIHGSNIRNKIRRNITVSIYFIYLCSIDSVVLFLLPINMCEINKKETEQIFNKKDKIVSDVSIVKYVFC